MKTKDEETIRARVREGYAEIARSGGIAGKGKKAQKRSCGCCGGGTPADELAEKLGYDAGELATLPDGANMGLSCGNPTALAKLKPGEVVVDLGSGGGFDVFQAAKKVGSTGRAIGIDMTADMLSKARANIVSFRERSGLDNVEFRLGEIEHLPVADNSVDAIISNCVINLSPDKPQVWREMFRVLKPGGRVAVSDLALLEPLPPKIVEMVEALVGCVAGAALVEDTRRTVRATGFSRLKLTEKSGAIDAMTIWNDPLYRRALKALPAGKKASDYITSLYIEARKPSPRGE